MPPVKLLIVGAGSRGQIYAAYAQEQPQLAQIVGVAEPRDFYRRKMAQTYDLPAANVVADWQELVARPKFADAVVIATPDAQHAEPAVAFAQTGYAILLEKPMAPNPADCERLVQAVRRYNNLFAVCHVMRYTAYSQLFKRLVGSGAIGEIVSVQHLEPVGYWHYAHSFVRGNWRNEAESSFMLLAKSCHDIDWLRYIIGQPCTAVSSFGSLQYFRREKKPPEAGDALSCLRCAHEPACAYSARRIYLSLLEKGVTGWPLDVISPEPTAESVLAALAEGPYGRCVWECDNDVVDRQVVNLLYANGVTASFTMVGTSELRNRQTTIFGTKGELRGDGERILHYDFLTGRTEIFTAEKPTTQRLGGHGGGDYAVIESFVAAVANNDSNLILSGATESLETHLTVFAAEAARRAGQVVHLQEYLSHVKNGN